MISIIIGVIIIIRIIDATSLLKKKLSLLLLLPYFERGVKNLFLFLFLFYFYFSPRNMLDLNLKFILKMY